VKNYVGTHRRLSVETVGFHILPKSPGRSVKELQILRCASPSALTFLLHAYKMENMYEI